MINDHSVEIDRKLTNPQLKCQEDSPSLGQQNAQRSEKIVFQQKIQEECLISQVFGACQSTEQKVLEVLAYLLTCGLLLLLVYWFQEWRFKLFFSLVPMSEATFVVVYGPDGDIQILSLLNAESSSALTAANSLPSSYQSNKKASSNSSEIELPLRIPYSGIESNIIAMSQFRDERSVFEYRFNKYQFNGNEFVSYADSAFTYTNAQLKYKFKQGATPYQIATSLERNGPNKTDIPDKGVLNLLFEELISPFYLFQIGSTILWLFENYKIYAYIIISTSTLSLMVKIYEERQNFSRLRTFSYFRGHCDVIRNGKKITIETNSLAFGDKLIIQEGSIAPCDVVLIKGSAIVNEAMLTGESVPIVKTPITDSQEMFNENKQNVIYCGSMVSQTSHDLECVVIRIGFETLKGNLIRSIMYPKSHTQISFKNDSGKFILILGIAALICFFSSLPTFIHKIDLGLMQSRDVILRCLDLITISVPPALPTCLSFGISFSLRRMRFKQVYCINPEKINICGIVKTICFDKTGTLTEEKLSFKLVASLTTLSSSVFQEYSDPRQLPKEQQYIMAACHSLMLMKNTEVGIAGDPLDMEMFESTKCVLVPEKIPPLQRNIRGLPVIGEIALDGKALNREAKNVISILKRFQFEAEVERMSSLIAFPNSDQICVIVKGSPEKIRTICTKESIPANFTEVLSKYTKEGFRVIALSYKSLLLPNNDQLDAANERDFYEINLTFAGFLIFENKLKPETTANIALLKQNDIQIHMVTGDNPLTSLSVAKQCDILDKSAEVSVLDTVVIEKNVHVCSLDGVVKNSFNKVLFKFNTSKQYVVTGTFFQHFVEPLKHDEKMVKYLPQLLSSTKVYARMKPDQKQSLIRLLQTFQNVKNGYSFIGMCGDGANDCQALKDADMGISLGEAEASIAASFTSKVTNISIIEFILREGRGCLATSFQCFKFMALYSIIQTCTTGILYQRGAVPGDFQFLYWDLFIIIPLAFLIGLTHASDKLTPSTPTHRLFSHPNIISVIGMGLIQFAFQIAAVVISVPQDWYISPIEINKQPGMDPSELLDNSFDNAILFWVANFQYICSVVAFSVGSEHKKPFYSNSIYSFFLALITALSVYAIFSQQAQFTDFFAIDAIAYNAENEPVSIMPYSWRWVISALIIANITVNILYEKYLLPYLITFYERLIPNSIYESGFVSTDPKQNDSSSISEEQVSS